MPAIHCRKTRVRQPLTKLEDPDEQFAVNIRVREQSLHHVRVDKALLSELPTSRPAQVGHILVDVDREKVEFSSGQWHRRPHSVWQLVFLLSLEEFNEFGHEPENDHQADKPEEAHVPCVINFVTLTSYTPGQIDVVRFCTFVAHSISLLVMWATRNAFDTTVPRRFRRAVPKLEPTYFGSSP